MKQIILTTIVSLLFGGIVEAQIGIQTEFPRTILHVDPKRDNPLNTTTPLTLEQEQNDVVISDKGNLGVGIITPQEKLHVRNDRATSGDNYGLRLTPGYGGAAMLTLNTDGQTVRWGPNASLGQRGQFQLDNIIVHYGTRPKLLLSKLNGTMNMYASDFMGIPSEGRYLVNIDLQGLITGAKVLTRNSSVYLYLLKTNLVTGEYERVDAIEIYLATAKFLDEYVSFSTALYAGYCYPHHVLALEIVAAVGFGNAESGAVSTLTIDAAYPSIITVYNI